MKKIEYKIFNMSEADKFKGSNGKYTKTWVDILNEHGLGGWQVVDRLGKSSYLLMREIK